MGNLHLFIKMLREEYRLGEEDLWVLNNRMMADDKEFEKIWKLYKAKAKRTHNGVDEFRLLLNELLS